MPRFDEAWLLGIIRKCLAQLLDAGRERVITDEGPVPHRGEQLFLADRLSGMRHQRLEHRRSLRREFDLPFAGPQAPGFEIEPMTTEANTLLHRTLPALVGTATIPAASRTSGQCAHHTLCGKRRERRLWRHAAPLHSCKYRRLHSPATNSLPRVTPEDLVILRRSSRLAQRLPANQPTSSESNARDKPVDIRSP